ncbi:hypothetical protein GF406_21305 [candidate division KSB1 bacterium]|nr:hypothetical protein [candidate division KSB1 bacterium]
MHQFIRGILYILGGLLTVGLISLAVLIIWYQSIVNAGPGELETGVNPGELGQWVDPFIGTGGVPWVCANNFPGAMMPFGMVRLGPETASLLLNKRALNMSGYYYGDNKILGFSHTRLIGTGAVDGGHVLMLPMTEIPKDNALKEGPWHRFSHANEIAFPGYYAVRFENPDLLAEMTASERCGVHRYTFESGSPLLWLDITHALGNKKSRDGRIYADADGFGLSGHVTTYGSFSGRYGGIQVFFVIRFNRPWSQLQAFSQGQTIAIRDSLAADDLKLIASFAGRKSPTTLDVDVALSHVSIDNARENLAQEIGDRSFEQVFAANRDAWEARLGHIRIRGATNQQNRIFYTALYRTMNMPTRFADVNGQYKGLDKQIHTADGFHYYTDLSLWDTFRTVHPLYTLIAPGDQRDMVVSLIEMSKQGGWLPRWPSGYGYTNSMLGTPADIVIAETWLKGIRDVDIDTAYKKMLATATGPTPESAAFSGREGIGHMLDHGYCPSDRMSEAVARTVEFGWADHSLALLARDLGDTSQAAWFAERSRAYQNLWNPETQFLEPRDSQGDFSTPFKPLKLTYLDSRGEITDDYVEGSAWHWRFSPFYDGKGLVSLFSSSEAFVRELERFFEGSRDKLGYWKPDAYYWHGNEPCIHAAYLFNDAGRPDLARQWVRWVLETKYDDGFTGLDGNDDAGTLSAWYVFSALGFYPVAGTDRYHLGLPLFEYAAIKVGNGRTLEIEVENFTPDNLRVSGIRLNSLELNRTWITHEEIVEGGVLRFVL